MFTKEILMDLFKKNKKINFIIYTNIPRGCFSGVSYDSYCGNCNDESHNIKGFADSYMVLERTNEKGVALRTIYVLYENITKVEFFADKRNPIYDYKGKLNLKEI
jgi:hypothetical protein